MTEKKTSANSGAMGLSLTYITSSFKMVPTILDRHNICGLHKVYFIFTDRFDVMAVYYTVIFMAFKKLENSAVGDLPLTRQWKKRCEGWNNSPTLSH